MASANILGSETSPYLQQHATNPVYWQTWEKTDFIKLKQNKQLLLISIGYATCHWCHVMEKECFESKTVARVMNRTFHCIKIDREERPDLDQIYMQALQLLTGQGGWPLNIIALPDGRPIWGCTYLPKDRWMASLNKIKTLQKDNPKSLEDYADAFEGGLLEAQNSFSANTTQEDKQEQSKNYLPEMLKGRDPEWGGFNAPKFPMPVLLRFFQYAGSILNNSVAKLHFKNTIKKMALGGIHDPIEGGFSRYSVDERWHIPHFEKMGYDNGQLLTIFSEAYLEEKNPLYRDRIYSCFQFLKYNLLQQQGGFSCALDADSQDSEGKTREGAYYTWTTKELKTILGNDFKRFQDFYNINSTGYWEKEQYVLFQTETAEAFAKRNNIQIEDFLKNKRDWQSKLQRIRKRRPKPLEDSKVVSSWNALIASGLCKAYQATSDEEIASTASASLKFIQNQLITPEGTLLRLWKKESEGYLEDYATVIQALLIGYQTFFRFEYLNRAKSLFDYCLQHFYDSDTALFYFKNKNQKDSLFNPIEIEDNVIPSSNAIMTENQWWLSRYFSIPAWKQAAQQRVRQLDSNIASYPKGYALWQYIDLLMQQTEIEIVITGQNAFRSASNFSKQYSPNLLIVIGQNSSEEEQIPMLAHRTKVNKTTFYVCQNQSCLFPTTSEKEALKQLKTILT